MKKNRISLLGIVVIIVLQAVLILPVQADEYSGYLDQVIKMAQKRYYQDIPEEELLKGALRGIFDTMDEYTTFFDLEEAGSFLNSMEGKYQGIGVEITEIPEGVMVTRVFSNSPAEGAGLLPNDRIVKVDEKVVKGYTSQEIANLIRGESGTFVEIGIIREDSLEPVMFLVQRGEVNISPVKWMVDGDVMYIKLDSFSGNSAHFFDQALDEMDSRGLKKMILDLRNNPGGEVNQAVNIARHLVRNGVITTLEFKSEDTDDVVYQSFLYQPKYIPAVLINGNSASASEILASAIQDSKDGFLVGTKTYGKGVVQNLYPVLTPQAYDRYKELYGESIVNGYDWINHHGVAISESELIGWIKITTGHYLTRSGEIIHGQGVLPDFEIEEYELVKGLDIQNISALESAEEIPIHGVGNDVYHAEKILTIKGYTLDTPDNVLDIQTVEALKQFQHDKGISVTGIVDKATQIALNEELKSMRLEIDRPYAKAMELLNYFK